MARLRLVPLVWKVARLNGPSKWGPLQTSAPKRGLARLLLDRTRDLSTHGTAHRGASGVAMPTDEDDQDDHFLFNHPERGGNFAAA